MTFDGVLYCQGEGKDREGPFCQRCFDADGKAVRLQKTWNEYRPPLRCAVCDQSYGPSEPFPDPPPLESY